MPSSIASTRSSSSKCSEKSDTPTIVKRARTSTKKEASDDTEKTLSEAYRSILGAIEGEDADRAGIRDTPLRAAKAFAFMTSGYKLTLPEVIGGAIFPLEEGGMSLHSSGMLVVKDIRVDSLCEHHLLPFFGRAHIAYLPGNEVLGLSKFARIVDMFGRRLQMQERLTRQIAEAIVSSLSPRGVAVVLECSHQCMCARGVKQHEAVTRTSVMDGAFAGDAALQAEFWQHIAHSSRY